MRIKKFDWKKLQKKTDDIVNCICGFSTPKLDNLKKHYTGVKHKGMALKLLYSVNNITDEDVLKEGLG